MPRFLAVSFVILALAVSAAGVAPAAHAENAQEGEACEIGIGGCAIGLVCDAKGICQKDSGAIFGPAEPTQAEKDAVAKRQAEVDKAKEASWGFDWIMAKIMSLFALLVGIAALTLNYAMYYTVVDMGGYVTHLSAIGTVWKILRDIGNIMLIFGFLAIGISIIIDSAWYGGGQKLLPKLLIVAVFANFSLFAAEAVIDVGNLFATQIYKQINGGNIPNPSDTSADTGFEAVIQKKGVAGVLMTKLGLPSIYGGMKEVDADGKPLFAGGAPFYMSFMSIIVFIVVAFVMFTLAFILVSRFIVLILIIMVSPVGIMGLAVPGLQGWADKWWSTLFHQTITAPILLLMLYIALSVIVDPKFLGFDTNARPAWNGVQTGNVIGFAGILLSYLIAMGLLLAVVYFAKTLSAVGAGWATKMGGRLSFGAVSLGARATFGSAGNLLASKRMQAWAREGKYGSKYVKRGVVLAGKGLRSATYDLRNAPGAATGLGAFGIDAGKGATLTAKQAHDAQYGKKAVDAWFQASKDERDQAGKEIDFKKAQKEIQKIHARYGTGPLTPAQEAARATEIEPHEKIISSALSKMSTKQLEELGGIKKGVDSLVNNLSPQQFEALMKSDKLNNEEKDRIKKVRFAELDEKIDKATQAGATPRQIEDAQKELAKVSIKELPHLGNALLTNNFVRDNLTNAQYEHLSKEGVLNKIEKTTLDARRKARFDPAVTNSAAIAVAIKTLRWDKDQIKKLPADTLTHRGVLDALGADALNLVDIARTANMSPVDRKKLGEYLEDIATTPGDPRQADFAAYLAADPRVKRDLLIT